MHHFNHHNQIQHKILHLIGYVRLLYGPRKRSRSEMFKSDPSILLWNFNRSLLGPRWSIFEADNATEITSTSSTT
jgi:hypothetical protein